MHKALTVGKWLAEHRLAVLGFAVAAAYWPAFLQGAFTPRWIVIAIGLPLLCKLDPRDLPESMRWVLLFLLSIAAISTTFASPDVMTGYFELLMMGLLCLAFLAGAGMADLDDVMSGLGAGLALSSYIVLMEINNNDGRNAQDMAGLFFNKEVLSEFAALVFVWGVTRPHPVALVAIIPVLFCGSRIALLVSIIGVLYAFRPRSKWLLAALICALIGAAAMALIVFGPAKMLSAEHRITVWGATIFAWTQFGHGLGWFLTNYQFEQFAHSDALQMVAELGVGAFTILAIPFVAFRYGGGDRAARATFAAGCVMVCVSFPLHLPASGFVIAVVAGHLVGAGYRLRVGQFDRGVDDGAGLQREAAAYCGDSGAGGRFGGALPAGPVFASSSPLRAPATGTGSV